MSRHSPLPELQSFVSLFRPKRIIPNTLDPSLKNLDWAAIDCVFQSCCRTPNLRKRSLIPAAPTAEHLLFIEIARESPTSINLDDEEDDVAVKNIVADSTENANLEARMMAKKWLVGPGHGVDHSVLKGRTGRRLDVLRSWLGLMKWDGPRLDEGSSPAHPWASTNTKGKGRDEGTGQLRKEGSHVAIRTEPVAYHRSSSDNGHDSSDDEEAHERTARLLFGDPDDYPFEISQDEDSLDAAEVQESLTSQRNVGDDVEPRTGVGRMTPESSPIRVLDRRNFSLASPSLPNRAALADFVTSTPNGKAISQSLPEPFIPPQSCELIAQDRSLRSDPSLPGPSTSKVPSLRPTTPHGKSIHSKGTTVDSPIHLISSSPSSESNSRADQAYPNSRMHRLIGGIGHSGALLSTPPKDRKRNLVPPDIIDLTLTDERPMKRPKVASTSRPRIVEPSTRPLNEVKNIPVHNRTGRSTSSSADTGQNVDVIGSSSGKQSDSLSSPKRNRTALQVSITSPVVLGSSKPSLQKQLSSRQIHPSPQRTKSELLDKQLRIAQKAALARKSNQVAPTFEANCAKLVKRREHAKLKEMNAREAVVVEAAAELVAKRQHLNEFEKSRGNILAGNEDSQNGRILEQSRALQRRVTEDLQLGRRPMLPQLRSVQDPNSDDM